MTKLIKVSRLLQEVGHCGPTSVSMLLSCHDRDISQQEIAQAAGLEHSITEKGARVDELAQAVDVLCPDLTLMGRYGSNIEAVTEAIGEFNSPVVVEWQGLFRRQHGTGYFREGHYSVIRGCEPHHQKMFIVDPDRWSVVPEGPLPSADFLPYWWEDNETPGVSGRLGENRLTRSFGLFCLVLKVADSEKAVKAGLHKMDLAYVLENSHPIPHGAARRGQRL